MQLGNDGNTTLLQSGFGADGSVNQHARAAGLPDVPNPGRQLPALIGAREDQGTHEISLLHSNNVADKIAVNVSTVMKRWVKTRSLPVTMLS